jgi:hypothetical protein
LENNKKLKHVVWAIWQKLEIIPNL